MDASSSSMHTHGHTTHPQLAAPFALLGGLHFAAITDLTWSTDGQFLVASSRDGYCSVVAFDSGELGDVVPNAEVEATVAARMVAAQKSLRPLEAQQPRGGGTPGGHVPRAPEAATPVAAPVIVEAPVAEVAAPVAEVAAPVAGAAPAAAPPGLADAATKRRIVPTAVQAVVPVRELAPPSDGAGCCGPPMVRATVTPLHRCGQAAHCATKDVTRDVLLPIWKRYTCVKHDQCHQNSREEKQNTRCVHRMATSSQERAASPLVASALAKDALPTPRHGVWEALCQLLLQLEHCW